MSAAGEEVDRNKFFSFGNIKCATILENSSALFTKVVMSGYYLLLAEVFSLKEQSCVLFLCFISVVLSLPCWSLVKLLLTNWACPLQPSVWGDRLKRQSPRREPSAGTWKWFLWGILGFLEMAIRACWLQVRCLAVGVFWAGVGQLFCIWFPPFFSSFMQHSVSECQVSLEFCWANMLLITPSSIDILSSVVEWGLEASESEFQVGLVG